MDGYSFIQFPIWAATVIPNGQITQKAESSASSSRHVRNNEIKSLLSSSWTVNELFHLELHKKAAYACLKSPISNMPQDNVLRWLLAMMLGSLTLID
jgi:hypothetical protein